MNMWGVVVGVVIVGFVVAAILGAFREKPVTSGEPTSGWGTPNQAKALVVALVILALAILWAVSANSS